MDEKNPKTYPSPWGCGPSSNTPMSGPTPLTTPNGEYILFREGWRATRFFPNYFAGFLASICVAPIVLYTNLDAQCDKPATVVGDDHMGFANTAL